MEFFNDLADPILLPLPAFTKERYRQRFESFCGELSRRLIIDNGFPAVRIEYDREQQKGTQQAARIRGVVGTGSVRECQNV